MGFFLFLLVSADLTDTYSCVTPPSMLPSLADHQIIVPLDASFLVVIWGVLLPSPATCTASLFLTICWLCDGAIYTVHTPW
ncbi:uncharacterized protein SCHCODRAFT_02260850 [Schizophyllum commune H4-8]|uniref:uncharacterized protein n=1 Tax=Schizophyllum commune (strain H4-8 / FGSC 9210) TaxID=578458 RepID=UPI0021604724|nr:uncharacterized protein SCHCODRAFT_02260850 [Schizophyllum commune H4-8]KAI5893775.1 hypothetical protein SCHCODRAFT_02260850 [Schizophyllum commune H4-8]